MRDPDRRTATVVGVFFVLATVASILGSAALGSVLDGHEYLVAVRNHDGRVILAVLLFLMAASSAFATAFLLFPILRRYAEGLAAGYVGLRTFENVFYVASVVVLLVMLSVSRNDAIGRASVTDVRVLGATLLALHGWSGWIGTAVFFACGGVILNFVLYRARLVPRWLSAWGFVGATLAFFSAITGIIRVETGLVTWSLLLSLPIALQEMVFAVWLIAKGFSVPTATTIQAGEGEPVHGSRPRLARSMGPER